MALEITYIKQQAPEPKVVASERLYKTADGKRLVPEGHPDAAFLFCTPGREVPKEAFEGYELDASLTGAAAEDEGQPEPSPFPGNGESEAEAEGEPEPEETEKKEKPKRKARRKAADKAVKGPEGDK